MLLSFTLPVVVLFAALSAASANHVRGNGHGCNSQGSRALTWHVSNFTTGCSPGGCVFDLSILAFGTKNTPGFNTTCSGTDEQDGYKPCADKNVRAQLNPLLYPEWNVKVKHVWMDNVGGEFESVGETNVTSGTKAFKIPVGLEYGVG